MAQKKPKIRKDRKYLASLIRNKRREFWKLGDYEEWFSFLTSVDPNGRWRKQGTSLIGLCRNHNDHDPSLKVFPSKGFAVCYACPDRYYADNPVRLLSTITGKNTFDSIKLLQTHFDGDPLFKRTQQKELEEYDRHIDMKQEVLNVIKWSTKRAIMAYKAHKQDILPMTDTEYHYAQGACEYLENRKVMSVAMNASMGIFPNLKILDEAVNTLKIPDHVTVLMKNYIKSAMDVNCPGWLVFARDSSPTEIGTFFLRKPTTDGSKVIHKISDPFEDHEGLFGLSMYRSLHQDAGGSIGNSSKALVVEGEFDQLSISQGQEDASDYDWIVLSHGGSGNHNLKELTDYGLHTVYYVPDFDDAGVGHAKDILTQNPELNIKIFNWPAHLRSQGPEEGLDLDTAINKYGFSSVSETLRDEKHFVKAQYWAKQRCIEEIKDSRYEDNEIALTRTVADWARCLPMLDSENQNFFIEDWSADILKKFNISVSMAKAMSRSIAASEDPEMAFLDRMEKGMAKRFAFLCVETNSTSRPMRVWDRKKEVLDSFKTNSEADIEAYFGNNMGPWLDWVQRNLGEPEVCKYGRNLEDGENPPPALPVLTRENYVNRMSKYVVKRISEKVPVFSNLKTKKAGNHYLETKEGIQWFVVNGGKIFRGYYGQKSPKVIWDELDKPVFEGNFFDIKNREKYSEFINCLEDLTEAPDVPIKDMLLAAKDVLSEGWTFKNQELESLFNAAIIVAAPILKIFPKNIQMFASAERNSGKTTFVSKMIGGAGKPFYNLVEHSIAVDSATEAGIRQIMDGNPRLFTLDEFDNTDNSKGSDDKHGGILKIFRMILDGGTHVQGNSNGTAEKKDLDFSVMFAGIDPKMTDANLSRLLRIELKGVDSKTAPEITLERAFGKEYLKDLRRKLSLCMFNHAPLVASKHAEIINFYTDHKELLPANKMDRWLNSAYVALAIIAAADLDWKKFFADYLELKKHQFTVMSSSTEFKNLWDDVFNTPAFDLEGAGFLQAKKTLATVLATPEDRYKINKSETGVYYYEQDHIEGGGPIRRKYIVAYWPLVRNSLFKMNPSYRGLSTTNYCEKAGRHPEALSSEKIINLLPGLADAQIYNGLCGETGLSVLDITDSVQGYAVYPDDDDVE